MTGRDESDASAHAIQAAARIRALNSINEDIPPLLTSASTALASLTSKPLPEGTSTSTPALEARKETFQKATESYFNILISLSSRLRSEVDALEDAGILPAETARRGTAGFEDGVTNAGLGGFDVGVLNARVGDPGKGWEGEVVGKAKQMLAKKLDREDRDEEMKD